MGCFTSRSSLGPPPSRLCTEGAALSKNEDGCCKEMTPQPISWDWWNSSFPSGVGRVLSRWSGTRGTRPSGRGESDRVNASGCQTLRNRWYGACFPGTAEYVTLDRSHFFSAAMHAGRLCGQPEPVRPDSWRRLWGAIRIRAGRSVNRRGSYVERLFAPGLFRRHL